MFDAQEVTHFVLHLGGENLLADLGSGLYTKQYFSSDRCKILRNSAESRK